MPNLAVVLLLLQIAAPIVPDPTGSVRGVVRSDATGAGVNGVRIEAIDALAGIVSDSLGGYTLQGLKPGPHRLRFSAPGFESLAIDVLVVEGIPLGLDVSLTPIPARLVSVRVLAPMRLRGLDTSMLSFEPGTWTVSGETVRNNPMLAEPDAFRLLAAAPQAHMSPESPASLHVRGGSADQNLFLLDGAPVFSPVHSGQLLSAFSPDIVDVLILHGAAPSARYGGQLSSVVDVRTPSSIPPEVEARGGFGPTAARASVDIPMIREHAGILLSARHSYSGLRRHDAAEKSMPGIWFDLFGKLSLRLGSNDVTFSSFAADNALGFPATSSHDDVMRRATRDNSFEWATTTQSIAWRRDLGARVQLEALGWRAHFNAGVVWNPDSASLALRSAIRSSGLSTALSFPHGRGRFVSGFQLEGFSSVYDVSRTDTAHAAASDSSLLRRSASPVVGSVFGEERWSPFDVWTVTAGVRATFVRGRAARAEPRVSLSYNPSAHAQLSVGYARMHQYTQSLRGEESFLGTVVGPDFLVGVGGEVIPGMIPVANSDELSASALIPLRKDTRLRFDWYRRALHNLILPASASPEPFVSRSYAIGSGEAWGLAASVETRVRKVSFNAVYSVGFAERVADSTEFRPAYAPRQSLSLALGYDATPRTNFHSAMWLAAGRPTTMLADDIGWDTRDPLTGARELSGSPQRADGPLNGSRLPHYLRFDVGARHTMPLWRSDGQVTMFAGVNNIFGRENTTGYVRPAGTSDRSTLTMLPATIVLGLEWRF